MRPEMLALVTGLLVAAGANARGQAGGEALPGAELLEFLADWAGAETWLDERLGEAPPREEARMAPGADVNSKEAEDEAR